jgi:uncharacterized coiled-coil protein SlyX
MSDSPQSQLDIREHDEPVLVDAIATLSEVLRRRLELLERSETLLLSALTTMSDLMTERMEALDRNQRALMEAVNRLEWPSGLQLNGPQEPHMVHLPVHPDRSA